MRATRISFGRVVYEISSKALRVQYSYQCIVHTVCAVKSIRFGKHAKKKLFEEALMNETK